MYFWKGRDNFGASVAVSGFTAVVGAPGWAWKEYEGEGLNGPTGFLPGATGQAYLYDLRSATPAPITVSRPLSLGHPCILCDNAFGTSVAAFSPENVASFDERVFVGNHPSSGDQHGLGVLFDAAGDELPGLGHAFPIDVVSPISVGAWGRTLVVGQGDGATIGRLPSVLDPPDNNNTILDTDCSISTPGDWPWYNGSFASSAVISGGMVALGAPDARKIDGNVYPDSTGAVYVYAIPPTDLDLIETTADGFSGDDNITNHDNSTGLNELSFNVTGTVDMAAVTLYAEDAATVDGTDPYMEGAFEIGTLPDVVGTSYTMTTDGVHSLDPGTYYIVACQTPPGGTTQTGYSPRLKITIDTTHTSDPRTRMALEGMFLQPVDAFEGVSGVTLVFNEPFPVAAPLPVGLPADRPGFTLTRDGVTIPLTSIDSTFTYSADGMTWWFTPNASLIAPAGIYILTFNGGDFEYYDEQLNRIAVPGLGGITTVTWWVFTHEPASSDAPTVVSVTPNVALISDLNVGTATFWLEIAYSKAMNTNSTPALQLVSFGDPDDLAGTLTYNAAQSWWVSDTTFKACYDVADVDVIVPDPYWGSAGVISVSVRGAHDGAPTPQAIYSHAIYYGATPLRIDTVNEPDPANVVPPGFPTVTQVTAVNAGTAEYPEANGQGFALRITYDHAMNTNVRPTITFTSETTESVRHADLPRRPELVD